MKKCVAFVVIIAFLVLLLPVGAAGAVAFSLSPLYCGGLEAREIICELCESDSSFCAETAFYAEKAGSYILSARLEDPVSGQECRDISVFLNGKKTKHELRDGVVTVKAELEAGEGLRAVVTGFSRSSFFKASSLIHDLSAFEGERIGHVLLSTVLTDGSCAMASRIFPGHWTENEGRVSVEYWLADVNPVSSRFILEKYTWDDLWRQAEETPYNAFFTENLARWIEDTPELDLSEEETEYGYFYPALEALVSSYPDLDEMYPYLYNYPGLEGLLSAVVLRSALLSGCGEKVYAWDFEGRTVPPIELDRFLRAMAADPDYIREQFPCYGLHFGVEYASDPSFSELFADISMEEPLPDGSWQFTRRRREISQDSALGYDRMRSRRGSMGARITELWGYLRRDAAEYLNGVGADMLMIQKLFDNREGIFEVIEYPWGPYMETDGLVGYREGMEDFAEALYSDYQPDYPIGQWLIKSEDEGLMLSRIPAAILFLGSVSKDGLVIFDGSGLYDGYRRGLTTARAALSAPSAIAMTEENDRIMENNRREGRALAETVEKYRLITETPGKAPDRTFVLLIFAAVSSVGGMILASVWAFKKYGGKK